MVDKNIPFDPDFQSIFDEAIAFLFKETLTEPGWKGISHLFESECYDEVLNGLICTLVDLEGMADSEFNDQFLSEYLDEGEKINNKKRVEFARDRISLTLEDYSAHVFSLHEVKIQSKEREAILGFSVSGFSIDCLGVFPDEISLIKNFGKNYLNYGSRISDAHLLRLWRK